MASPLPPPSRVVLSNRSIPSSTSAKGSTEPAVEVIVDPLQPTTVMEGILDRAPIANHTSIPTSNDGPGRIQLDAVPGSGIVLPGGANIYYLDFAPGSQVPMHRTSSTDYVIVLEGALTVLTPPAPFDVVDGKGTYVEAAETLCRQGDVVVQRGAMHAWANRTESWVRLLCVVLGASPLRAVVEGKQETRLLEESWLQ